MRKMHQAGTKGQREELAIRVFNSMRNGDFQDLDKDKYASKTGLKLPDIFFSKIKKEFEKAKKLGIWDEFNPSNLLFD